MSGYEECLIDEHQLDLQGMRRVEVIPDIEKFLNGEYTLLPTSLLT